MKEATSRNVENFQTSLNLQQTYSASLCLHVNNIYNKLAELWRQIQHHDLHMNSGDTVQIEAPDFDLDINNVSSPTMNEISYKVLTQGTASPTPKSTKPEIECSTPATSIQQTASQDTDWPDAIPVEIPLQIDSYLAHHNTYEASQYIHQQYRSHLHALDDEMYYEEDERSHNLDCSFRNIYIVPSFPTREQHTHSVQNARSRFNKLNQSYSC